jgi:hypothetical protein
MSGNMQNKQNGELNELSLSPKGQWQFVTAGAIVQLSEITPPATSNIISDGFHKIIHRRYETPHGEETLLLGQLGANLYFLRYDEEVGKFLTSDLSFGQIDYDENIELFVGRQGAMNSIISFNQAGQIEVLVTGNDDFQLLGRNASMKKEMINY